MLCCVCLLENTGTMGIYEPDGIELKIEQIIQQHLWFKVIKSKITIHGNSKYTIFCYFIKARN